MGSKDADGEPIDAPDAPDYDEPTEEAREARRAAGLSPDFPEWREWPLWAKLRFYRALRTRGSDRPEQFIDDLIAWYLWLLLGGRGSGKSDEAGRWSCEEVLRLSRIRFALVARTFGDVRDTMFEGETGLLAVLPESVLRGGSRDRAYNRSLGELFLANGSRFKGFTSEKPNQLRGPQHHRAWLDEASSWEDATVDMVEKADGTLAPAVDTTMSNLMLGLRLKASDGSPVRIVCATTPKPNPLTEFLAQMAERKGELRVLSTYSNLKNLDDEVAEVTVSMYEGTDVAAQELEGKILSAAQGAAWDDAMIAAAQAARLPDDIEPDAKVVLGVDPAVSSKNTSDETGLVAVERRGLDDPWLGVLDDRSGKIHVGMFPPAVLGFAEEVGADEICVEINNGYDFVVAALTSWCEAQEWTVIRRARKDLSTHRSRSRQVVEYLLESPDGFTTVLKPVWASVDKLTRAKAASVWWHRGRAWHAPGLTRLEKQMTTFDGTGKSSPDRLDGLSTACAAFAGKLKKRRAGVADPLHVPPPAGQAGHPLLAAAGGAADGRYSERF